jgi:hypothetical protein
MPITLFREDDRCGRAGSWLDVPGAACLNPIDERPPYRTDGCCGACCGASCRVRETDRALRSAEDPIGGGGKKAESCLEEGAALIGVWLVYWDCCGCDC